MYNLYTYSSYAGVNFARCMFSCHFNMIVGTPTRCQIAIFLNGNCYTGNFGDAAGTGVPGATGVQTVYLIHSKF